MQNQHLTIMYGIGALSFRTHVNCMELNTIIIIIPTCTSKGTAIALCELWIHGICNIEL